MIKTTLISAGAAMSDELEIVSEQGKSTIGSIKFQPFDYISDDLLAKYDELAVKDNRLVAVGTLHLVQSSGSATTLDGLRANGLNIDGSLKHGTPMYCGESYAAGEYIWDSSLNHYPEKRKGLQLIGAGYSFAQTKFIIQPAKQKDSRDFSARCVVRLSHDDIEKMKALKLRFVIKYSLWLNEDA
ncbi:hypothetical protein I2492_14095 [Budviciaceae bacterium CWB-B4]|uniref:Uncharacterized protein n=1 Tax=Limnobaculum xujianqingii TaxID=2738837 RepID=A0A9D7AJR1_9GAMM|nr:hypothetical protein [Limnobaculum xujianqingii]MBK5074140.1 hypothetical protein [Limnobaculum xujianqingii]MBK5177449.1 hypothetical protein [Limnobaculum xujianqingii]